MPSAKIMVVGRLTRDVEKTSENAPYKTAVAVDGLVKQGGEYKTKFYNLTIWGGTGAARLIENMAKKGNTLKKGSLVMVTGTPTFEVVEKDGATNTYDGISAESIDFVADGSKKAEGNGEGAVSAQSSGSNESAQGSLASGEDIPLL